MTDTAPETGADRRIRASVARRFVRDPLPRRVFRRLELAGLSVERSRRDEVVTFRRTV